MGWTLFFGVVLVELLFLILWVVYLAKKRIAIVDLGWVGGLFLAGSYFAICGQGWGWRRWILGYLLLIWGTRLLSHLLCRLKREGEDPRYLYLLSEWKLSVPERVKVLLLYLIQGASVVIVSIPLFLVAHHTNTSFSALEVVGILLWMWGVVGATVADSQLAKFNKASPDRSRVCREGLWHYSRHPNYFFEWLVWVAYSVIALAAPWGFLGVISPLFLLYLFLYVSGVPITEALALRAKGEEYAQYQRSTPVFLPAFWRCCSRKDDCAK